MAENQHWVPKFLIKQFVHKGRVYQLDIHTDEVSWPPPRLAASEEGFNDFIIDGEAVSFEDSLEKIETPAAPIIKRIVESKTLSGLNSQDRRRIAEFIAAQSIRTKAFYEGMADKPARDAFGATFQSMWDSISITAGMIAARPWVLLVIPGDDVFYLGDNPVILQWTETPRGWRKSWFRCGRGRGLFTTIAHPSASRTSLRVAQVDRLSAIWHRRDVAPYEPSASSFCLPPKR
jgi:hypothetical protein